jgi:hypothetical protein
MPTLPTLPQATVDTTYSLPTGTTHVCTTGAQFTTALANSALNDVIQLQAGNTFSGPFNLPNKTSGSGWIYIVSSALGNLPALERRVAIADSTNMPAVDCAGGSGRCITTSSTAHHFRFVGIAFQPQSGASPTTLVQIGNNETVTSDLPHHIIFDRCLVQGDPSVNSRRGIALNGDNVAVVDSYLHNFKDDSADSQAIWVYNSNGPVLIRNDFLEAAGENVMFGGTDPTIAGNVPSDITITRNYFFKRLSWVGSAWVVKNILEFKNAQRILTEGNLFENVWLAAQAGYMLNAKSVNQSGGAGGQDCIVQDLTFRNNRGKNLENGISLGGDLSEGALGALAPIRWSITNNEFQIANVNNGDGASIAINQGAAARILTNLTLKHNSFVGIRFFHVEVNGISGGGIDATDMDLKDNLFEGAGASAGFKRQATAEGTASLDAGFTNGTVTYNIWQGRSSSNYGAASGSGNTMANNFFPVAQSDIGFVNYAGANYRLTSGSAYHNAASDGTDVGANIDLIDSAIAGTGPFCLFKWK